jgi:hypothetical protein
VVDNPTRRKVIMDVILIGHIGIVASASTLILGFTIAAQAILGSPASSSSSGWCSSS